MADSDKWSVMKGSEMHYGGLDYKSNRRAYIAHLRKYWWAYSALSAVASVLVACLIVFVAVPAYAQHKVNQAVLTVEGLAALAPATDSYTISINSTLHSDSPVPARFDAFDGVLYLEDVGSASDPIMTVTFPAMSSDHVQTVNVTQRVPVNLKPFTQFNAWLMDNESVRVTVAGNTKVAISGISTKFDISFKKTVTIPGLKNFAGIGITQSNITLLPDSNGDNFRGFVNVPNPSIATFDLGNVSFVSYFENQNVGMVHLDNVMLRPGDNNVSVRANVSALVVVPAVTRKPYCNNGGVLPFLLHGTSVVNRGQSLPYYADALAQTNVTNLIPLGQDLKQLTGVPVMCLI